MKIKSYDEYEKVVNDAVRLYNSGLFEESRELFVKLAEYNFSNIKVHEKLTHIYLKLNDIENASKEYDILVELFKKKHKMPLKKSFKDLISELGDKESIEAEYKLLIHSLEEKKNVPLKHNTGIAIKMALIYIAEGNYRKAEEILTSFKDKFFKISR